MSSRHSSRPGDPGDSAEDCTRFRVVVSPRSSRTRCLGQHGEALKVALKAPPVDGAANAELVRFIAEELGLPRRAVRIVAGQSSKRKVVEVQGEGVRVRVAAWFEGKA